MSNHDLLDLNPVQEYTPPALPALADKPPLEKLPTRWKKNAAVVACVGIVGGMTLASCAAPLNDDRLHNGGGPVAPYYVTQPTEQETAPFSASYSDFDLTIRMHTGGGGAGPFYVVHLTEQEAMGIIQSQLETAGFNFDVTPPRIVLNEGENGFGPTISLDLYDAQRNAAVSFLSWEAHNTRFWHRSPRDVQEKLTQHRRLRNTTVGVIFNPGESFSGDDWWEYRERGEQPPPPSDEEIAIVVPILLAQLTAQVQDFIYAVTDESVATDLDFIIHRETVSSYALQLTKEQALEIIREQLEAAGLSFGAAPPEYRAEYGWNWDDETPQPTIGLALYDDQANVAVALLHDDWVWHREARRTTERFAELTDIPVGVFFNPRIRISDSTIEDRDHVPTPSEAQAANSAPVLYARLVAQVQTFIEFLQTEGIL